MRLQKIKPSYFKIKLPRSRQFREYLCTTTRNKTAFATSGVTSRPTIQDQQTREPAISLREPLSLLYLASKQSSLQSTKPARGSASS